MSRYKSLSQFSETRIAATWSDSEFARRLALAFEPASGDEAGKPQLISLLRELDLLVEPARRPFRNLKVSRAANPQTVMILPGFATPPRRMRYLAQQLERAGHTAKQWGAGFNWGPTEARFALLENRLIQLHAATGAKIVLLGWSLGGIFARELAKRHPDKVSKVITMGSPFSGSPRANNLWRIYQFITGFRVDDPPIEAHLAQKPPVETIALWSPRDGAIAPHCAAGLPGERDRAIRVNCTHSGYRYHPEAVNAVLGELESPAKH